MPLAEASASINAPIEVVWAAMMDVTNYKAWNPFIFDVDAPGAPLKTGDILVLHVRWQSGRTIKSTEQIATIIEPTSATPKTALLEYDFLGPIATLRLTRGRRIQSLTQGEDGITHYATNERLHGALSFLAPIKAVRDGFARHALALKDHCESQMRQSQSS